MMPHSGDMNSLPGVSTEGDNRNLAPRASGSQSDLETNLSSLAAWTNSTGNAKLQSSPQQSH
eukprot:4663598-Amphidinium_carterae.1